MSSGPVLDGLERGIDGPAFDVVIPSLPGYGFSPRPDVAGGVTYRYVARQWHQLMRSLAMSGTRRG